jgi:hypothetical protein
MEKTVKEEEPGLKLLDEGCSHDAHKAGFLSD